MSNRREHGRTSRGLPFNGSTFSVTSSDSGVTIVEEYRYYEKGDTPGTWFTYTGTETLAVNNATGSNVTYIVEKRRTLHYYGYEISQKSESWEVLIPPTPQPTVDNFSIDPAMAMSYGTWGVSFDVTYSPTWSGTDPTVELDILCYDGDSVLQKTINNVTLTKLGSTYSGDFTILESETWEYDGAIGYGDFEADVTVSAISGTTIPAGVGNHIFDGYWTGVPAPVGVGDTCDNPIVWDMLGDLTLDTFFYDSDIGEYGVWVELSITDGDCVLAYAPGEDTYMQVFDDGCLYLETATDDQCDLNAMWTNSWGDGTFRLFVQQYGGGEPSFTITLVNTCSCI